MIALIAMLTTFTEAAKLSPPTPCYSSGSSLGALCTHHTPANFAAEAVARVRRYDEEGDGLDADDIDLLRQRREADARGDRARRILIYDLNADFTVDRAEIERATPDRFVTDSGQRRSDGDHLLRGLFTDFDTNNDGRIDREEIFTVRLSDHEQRTIHGLRELLGGNPNNDGQLEDAEVTQLAQHVFRANDRDGDGRITQVDVNAIEERLRRERAEAAARRNPPPTDICGGSPAMPADFGPHGVQAQYSFVIQNAGREEMRRFLTASGAAGFSFFPITVSLRGYDTLFVPGWSALRDAAAIEREFRAACALRSGRIFVSHVRYNPIAQEAGPVRVR